MGVWGAGYVLQKCSGFLSTQKKEVLEKKGEKEIERERERQGSTSSRGRRTVTQLGVASGQKSSGQNNVFVFVPDQVPNMFERKKQLESIRYPFSF